MNFEPSKLQIELQERARDTVRREITPMVAALPRGDKLSAEQWRAIYRALKPLGYLGSTISPDIGGAGMSGIAEVLLNLGYRVTGSDLGSSATTRPSGSGALSR